MSGPEWVLVLLPLLWLGLATWQQCQDWRARRPPRDRAEPEARAEALLRELLPAADYEALRTRGYLEVPSRLYPGRRYRIYRRPRPVEVYERGRLTQALCVQPTVYLPSGDRVLMHKVLLEGDEARYLRTANVARFERLDFPTRPWRRPGA
ncbi:MAG TPA: hypothetical protein VFB73_06780 [Chloroflexota bacterium]|nr:hypothetical protein [Chloroflexota bacterium]HZU05660.1 hypothetical protein [Chloroflexota bacterium]